MYINNTQTQTLAKKNYEHHWEVTLLYRLTLRSSSTQRILTPIPFNDKHHSHAQVIMKKQPSRGTERTH